MSQESNKMVSVIIVSAGLGDYLDLCLDSLMKQTCVPSEIFVIDNSTDANFRQRITRSYPHIRLYSNQENLFYCQALNIGIHMSKGKFVLCLNDDVILDNKFIEEALKGFCRGQRVGMVSGKILRQDKKTIDSAGLSLSFWRTAKERGYACCDKGQFEKEGYIFGVNGAVAFYQREMLEAVKENNDYFDSDFHIFYEDLDISWRAQRLGWRGYYVPQAIAYHTRGATVRQYSGIDKPYARRFLNDTLQADLIKNRYLAIIKNEPGFSFLLHLPGIILYDLLVLGYIILFRPRLVKFFLNSRYLKNALKKRRSSLFFRR